MLKNKKLNIIFVYISEAHAVDVWPIGMSAGTLNYKHKTLNDRQECANKFIKEYDFNVNTYLDGMTDNLQFELSAWPFRYYIIESDNNKYKFKFIPNPSDSEFDLTEMFNHI
jgi:hypothetical protein